MASCICFLDFCYINLGKIHLLQFHVLAVSGWILNQTALLATKGNRITWNFACTYLYTCSKHSRCIVEFREHLSEWQLLHWACTNIRLGFSSMQQLSFTEIFSKFYNTMECL